MTKDTARTIADALTWARIASVVPISILAWYEFRWWVFGLYIAASVTDYFDGWFARRASPPKNDVDLDGLADLLLSVMTLLWLWMLVPGFFQKYGLPYFPILVLLEIYVISARLRFHQINVPHLQFGRIAMALFFFLLPVLILWGDVSWFVHGVLLVGTAAKVQVTWVVAGRIRTLRRHS